MLVPADPTSGLQWQTMSIKEIYVTQLEEDADFPLYITTDDQTIGGVTFDAREDKNLDGKSDYASLRRVFPAPSARPKVKH